MRYLSPPNSYGDIAELQFFSSTPGAAALPAVPTGLTATPGDGLVGLSWSASSGAVTYNIKRSAVSGGPYTNIANRTATLHMDSGLVSGTYYYVVSAVNAGGESANSTEASALLSALIPGAPTGLAIAAENGQLILAWSPIQGISSYTVLRATNRSGPFFIVATGLAAPGYADPTVTNKTVYYYAVQAVNSGGSSTNSNPVSASLALLNVAPVLGPIPNQTLVAGRTLLLTNLASDADAPPQTLTYTLLTPPTGAAINSASGVLSWRPTIAQSGTTNLLAVMVSDNGLPILSATRNFTVSVLAPAQPSFGLCTLSNGLFESSILGDFGPDYSVLGSTNLTDWELISTTNQPPIPFQFADPSITNGVQRFYRLRLGP